jgi:Domain of unknown function (DUF1883)/Lecithin retinol acyltransferase
MHFLDSAVTTNPGDLVQVAFRGTGANIGLMGEVDFQSFCAGHPFRFHGEYYRTSPVHLRPHSAGQWHVVVGFGGNAGSVRGVTVIPYQLIRITMQCRGRVAPTASEMAVQTLVPRYYTGELIQRADEIEVFYPDLHGIPHRGIIHSIQTGPMGSTITVIHKSKRDGGDSFISFADFEHGSLVNLRRRADSPQHADQIIERAESAIHEPYHWWLANCEHFTDWCYTGNTGKSGTKEAGVLVGMGVGVVAVLWASEAQ